MIKMVRIKDSESEKIRNKNIEINKKLVALEKEPVKDSELVHIIIEKALESITVTKSGDIQI